MLCGIMHCHNAKFTCFEKYAAVNTPKLGGRLLGWMFDLAGQFYSGKFHSCKASILIFDFSIDTFFTLWSSSFSIGDCGVLFLISTGGHKSHHQLLFHPKLYLKFLGKFNFFSFLTNAIMHHWNTYSNHKTNSVLTVIWHNCWNKQSHDPIHDTSPVLQTAALQIPLWLFNILRPVYCF